jgi:hypothetical protein
VAPKVAHVTAEGVPPPSLHMCRLGGLSQGAQTGDAHGFAIPEIQGRPWLAACAFHLPGGGAEGPSVTLSLGVAAGETGKGGSWWLWLLGGWMCECVCGEVLQQRGRR